MLLSCGPRRAPPAFFLLILLATLAAGLHPRDFRFRNEASFSSTPPGLRCDKFGIASTAPFLTPELAARLQHSGFSIELDFLPNPPSPREFPGFQFLFCLHDGRDDHQLLLACWNRHLILMHGNDYDHRRKHPRLTFPLPPHSSRPASLSIVSSGPRTRVFLDGIQVASSDSFPLRPPAGSRPARLILGNSPCGTNGWNGTITRLALFEGPPAPAPQPPAPALRVSRSSSPSQLVLLFNFRDSGQRSLPDSSGNGHHLLIPPFLSLPPRRIFDFSFTFASSNPTDILLNLLGFLPFGLASALLLPRLGLTRPSSLLLTTTLLALALASAIEYAQSWIPSRDSSPLDLALNTASTTLGTLGTLGTLRVLRVLRGIPRSRPPHPPQV